MGKRRIIASRRSARFLGIHRPIASHTFIVLSRDADTRRRPSAEKATAVTSPRMPGQHAREAVPRRGVPKKDIVSPRGLAAIVEPGFASRPTSSSVGRQSESFAPRRRLPQTPAHFFQLSNLPFASSHLDHLLRSARPSARNAKERTPSPPIPELFQEANCRSTNPKASRMPSPLPDANTLPSRELLATEANRPAPVSHQGFDQFARARIPQL